MSNKLTPVFDLGGVFVDWNPLHLFRKLFETEEEALWFHKNICTLEWNMEFDAGTSFESGIAQLITRYPRYWRQIQAYDLRWEETVSGMIEGTIAIHDELVEQNISTFAITNFSAQKWISMLDKWAFLSKFNGVVVSGIEEISKPDPRIYKLFCDRFELRPQECVFIDDNETNIHAAKAFGMEVIHFTSPDALRANLHRLGFSISPDN